MHLFPQFFLFGFRYFSSHICIGSVMVTWQCARGMHPGMHLWFASRHRICLYTNDHVPGSVSLHLEKFTMGKGEHNGPEKSCWMHEFLVVFNPWCHSQHVKWNLSPAPYWSTQSVCWPRVPTEDNSSCQCGWGCGLGWGLGNLGEVLIIKQMSLSYSYFHIPNTLSIASCSHKGDQDGYPFNCPLCSERLSVPHPQMVFRTKTWYWRITFARILISCFHIIL